jgi:hypothetical protein
LGRWAWRGTMGWDRRRGWGHICMRHVRRTRISSVFIFCLFFFPPQPSGLLPHHQIDQTKISRKGKRQEMEEVGRQVTCHGSEPSNLSCCLFALGQTSKSTPSFRPSCTWPSRRSARWSTHRSTCSRCRSTWRQFGAGVGVVGRWEGLVVDFGQDRWLNLMFAGRCVDMVGEMAWIEVGLLY